MSIRAVTALYKSEPKLITLDVTDITLLSANEAETLSRYDYLTIFTEWWLRSPGFTDTNAASVCSNGVIDSLGSAVFRPLGVRPVIKVENLKSLGLDEGDEIEMAGHRWMIVTGYKWSWPDDGFALCKDTIGECAFRKYARMGNKYFYTEDDKKHPLEELNDYDKSDVKAFLEDWASENGIEIRKAA